MSPSFSVALYICLYFIQIITSSDEYPSQNTLTPRYIHINEYELSNDTAWKIQHETNDIITSCSTHIPSLCIKETNATMILSFGAKLYDFSNDFEWNYSNRITSHSHNNHRDSRRRLRRRRRRRRRRRCKRRRCRRRRCRRRCGGGGGCCGMGMGMGMGMMPGMGMGGGMMPGMGSMGGMMPGMGSMGGMMPGMGSGMMPGMGSGMMPGMGMGSMGMQHPMHSMNTMHNMNTMGMQHPMSGMHPMHNMNHMHGGHTFAEPKVEVHEIHEKKEKSKEIPEKKEKKEKRKKKEKKEKSSERRRLIEIYTKEKEDEVYYEYKIEKCVVDVMDDDGGYVSICLVWDPWNDLVLMRYVDGDRMAFVDGYLQSDEWIVDDIDVNEEEIYECDSNLFIAQQMRYDGICIIKQKENGGDLSILMRSKVENELIFNVLDKLQWNEIYFVNEEEKKLCRYLEGRRTLCVELMVDIDTNSIKKIKKVTISQPMP